MFRFKPFQPEYTFKSALTRAILRQVNFYSIKVPRFLTLDLPKLLAAAPELSEALEVSGVLPFVDAAQLIVIMPNSDIPVHADLEDDRFLALNFPIHHCDGTHTVFYEPEGKAEKLHVHVDVQDDPFDGGTNARRTLGYAKYENATEISRVELNKPYWLNVGTAHNVQNFKNTIRVSLSLRFSEPIGHLIT
jgi:hypothetical protein